MLKIIRATARDVPIIAPLFDAYRVFYKQESDIETAHNFLRVRLSNEQSIVLIAFWAGEAVGFTQLYTTYSSVSLQSFYILNDLYVKPEFRGKGIGEGLLTEAKKVCKSSQFKGLALETAMDNPAQVLYEKLGWKKDAGYFHYFWTNTDLDL